jgi:hypothetical protein
LAPVTLIPRCLRRMRVPIQSRNGRRKRDLSLDGVGVWGRGREESGRKGCRGRGGSGLRG